MIKRFAETFKLNENKSDLNEAKAAMVSKELMKATEKMHAEQLKQQELQKKFVTETDPKKKEKMKADLIAQHKAVKKAEADFQEALGREHVDYDDELLETFFPVQSGDGREVKNAKKVLEKTLNDLKADYEVPQSLLEQIAEYIDAYADMYAEERVQDYIDETNL